MALLDIAALKAKIDNWITANGNREITGPQLNEILKDLIDSAPNLITNAGSIGLADYVPTEIYNENGEGQVVVFDNAIYQALDGELSITGAFDPLKWELLADISPNIITTVNGEIGDVVLDTDDIDDSSSLNKYVTAAEKALIPTAIQPGDNVSSLINDAGYLTDALQSGDNISELINDAGYVTSDTNLGNTDQTLTAERDIIQGGFDLVYDGRSVYGTGDYPLDAASFYGSGYARAIIVNGSYSSDAIQINNSGTGKALQTNQGNIVFHSGSASSKTNWGGNVDTQFRYNMLAGTDFTGGLAVGSNRDSGVNFAGYFLANGTATNIALNLEAQNGTVNAALRATFGNISLNENSGSTMIGRSYTSTPSAKLDIKGDVGQKMIRTESSSSLIGFFVEENGTTNVGTFTSAQLSSIAGTTSTGNIAFDSTLGQLVYYNGTTWVAV